MIRGEPRFDWLWPPNPFEVETGRIKRNRRGWYDAAERATEKVITAEWRKRFRQAVTEFVNETMIPKISTALETTLGEDTTERRIIRAMVQRDFLYTWLVSPNWRARLSYQQLMQARSWVPRILRGADPLARPFAEDVCGVEHVIKQLATKAIDDDFNPALSDNIERLADMLRDGSRADREDLATFFVIRSMRRTIVAPALEAYDQWVGR